MSCRIFEYYEPSDRRRTKECQITEIYYFTHKHTHWVGLKGAPVVEEDFLMGRHEYTWLCLKELAKTTTVWQSMDLQSRLCVVYFQLWKRCLSLLFNFSDIKWHEDSCQGNFLHLINSFLIHHCLFSILSVPNLELIFNSELTDVELVTCTTVINWQNKLKLNKWLLLKKAVNCALQPLAIGLQLHQSHNGIGS